jgi:hypothetical protein
MASRSVALPAIEPRRRAWQWTGGPRSAPTSVGWCWWSTFGAPAAGRPYSVTAFASVSSCARWTGERSGACVPNHEVAGVAQ